MHQFRSISRDTAAMVGWGVRVMLLAPCDDEGPGRAAARIAGFGGTVETESDIFAAVESLSFDAVGYGLFVMDCDGYGGLVTGRRAIALMGRAVERMPVILISREVMVQEFPEDPASPILLRAPLSAVSLRMGFEHALRERLVYPAD